MEKYETIFREINLKIDNFNALLVPDFRVAHLDSTNPESYSVIANVHWDDQVWPCGDLPGVYFLCAYQEGDPAQLGVYVGKASWGKIGGRIWRHLNPHRAANIYRMNNAVGKPYIIEAIATIGFRDLRMRSMASALEEFIIAGVRDRVHLLNAMGNA